MVAASTSSLLKPLGRLLAEQQDGVFGFLAGCSPYCRCTSPLGRLVVQIAQTSRRHAAELADLIQQLDGTPEARRIHSDYQYLAFLSLDFLLPKLVEEERRAVAQYEAALAAAGPDQLEARRVLEAQRQEHVRYFETLNRLAAPHEAR